MIRFTITHYLCILSMHGQYVKYKSLIILNKFIFKKCFFLILMNIMINYVKFIIDYV